MAQRLRLYTAINALVQTFVFPVLGPTFVGFVWESQQFHSIHLTPISKMFSQTIQMVLLAACLLSANNTGIIKQPTCPMVCWTDGIFLASCGE